MTAGLIFGAVGGWVVLAVLVAPRIGRMLARSEPPPAVDDTRWLPFLPPVPPTQAQIDATWAEPDTDWLAPWPVGDDDETGLRFAQIVAAQDWSQRP